MWSRRRFLESLAATPVVGELLGTRRGPSGAADLTTAAGKAGRDYFRELGVRPFINAAGTYTAMTASLMPPEVMEAINYASKHYVMLDELHDRVGERIATLVRAEAAMVTSGAASALTLGTAAVLTGTRPPEDRRSAEPGRHEERSHHPEGAPLRLRARRPQLRRAAGRSGDARRSGTRGQRQDRDDALLQQQQQGRADPGRGVRPARQEARRSPP